VSLSFAAAPEGDFFSDVLTLGGTAGDAIVLSLTYDAGSLGDLLPGDLFLGWLDTRPESDSAGEWVNSVAGNSVNLVAPETAYLGSWETYLADFSPASPAAALGAWGVDSSAASMWAVVDHNSEFAIVAVPEPGTWLLLAAAAAGLKVWQRLGRQPGVRSLRERWPRLAGRPGGRKVARDLAHALVVEHHRRAAWGHEDRHAVADHERVGVVDLEAVAIDQGHGEGPEGRTLAEGFERLVEVGGLHWVSSQAGGRNLNHRGFIEYTPVQILVKDRSLLLRKRRAETKGHAT